MPSDVTQVSPSSAERATSSLQAENGRQQRGRGRLVRELADSGAKGLAMVVRFA